MAGCLKLPVLDLGVSSANVFWKRVIDCYVSHLVCGVPEALEKGLGFTYALEGCRVAGLHVDADYFPGVIAHRVPEFAMAMLHASLLDVCEKADWGWLPAVLFLGCDTGCVALAKGPLGKFWVAQLGADCLESSVSLLCPLGVAVLEHQQLVD